MNDIDVSLGGKALLVIYAVMPLLFGLCFLGPLIWQIIEAMAWTPPFGLSAMVCGLIIGGIWGLIAQITGRWI